MCGSIYSEERYLMWNRYICIYIPRFDRRLRPDESNRSRSYLLDVLGVQGRLLHSISYLLSLFLYEGTYIRGLDTVRFVLHSGVRCVFGLFTDCLIRLTVHYQLRAETCANVKNLDNDRVRVCLSAFHPLDRTTTTTTMMTTMIFLYLF